MRKIIIIYNNVTRLDCILKSHTILRDSSRVKLSTAIM